MKLANLGFDPMTTTAVASAALPLITDLFGGGTNYANNFSNQAGTGRKYTQEEANGYYARSNQLGIPAIQLAQEEAKGIRRDAQGNIISTAIGTSPAAAQPSPFIPSTPYAPTYVPPGINPYAQQIGPFGFQSPYQMPSIFPQPAPAPAPAPALTISPWLIAGAGVALLAFMSMMRR